MVNEVKLKKAQKLRQKSMSVGMRYMKENIVALKAHEGINLSAKHPKINENNDNSRPS